jgi:hypothetical protein
MSSHGLVGESRNAQRAGNGGNRPTTHTGDSIPRPESGRRIVRGWRWLKRRMVGQFFLQSRQPAVRSTAPIVASTRGPNAPMSASTRGPVQYRYARNFQRPYPNSPTPHKIKTTASFLMRGTLSASPVLSMRRRLARRVHPERK